MNEIQTIEGHPWDGLTQDDIDEAFLPRHGASHRVDLHPADYDWFYGYDDPRDWL